MIARGANAAIFFLLLLTSAYAAALLAWGLNLTASDRLVTNAAFFGIFAALIVFLIHGDEWFAPFLKAFVSYALLSIFLMIAALMRDDLPISLRHALAAPIEWTGYYPMAGDASFVVGAPLWAAASFVVSLLGVTAGHFMQQIVGRNRGDDEITLIPPGNHGDKLR